MSKAAVKHPMQDIYLRKNRCVVLDRSTERPNKKKQILIATLLKNMESLGFAFSQKLAEKLLTHSEEKISEFYRDILPSLQKMVGAHRAYKPMYPNFPAQVMEASDFELYWNAILHYWTVFVSEVTGEPGVVYLPQYDKKTREKLAEDVALKVIDLGNNKDFLSIFTDLAGSNTSLSQEDKDILAWFVENYTVQELLPDSIPQKETLAFLVGCLIKKDQAEWLLPRIKTATDVLRVAVAMSAGDVSLAKPARFRRFARKERRFLLAALENCGQITEDMLRWDERWKRLGRELRPGDYKEQYPSSFKAFDVIRNDLPFATFNSKVEESFKSGKLDLKLLKSRPGSFARLLDRALRSEAATKPDVVKAFLSVASKVSTPVLLQVHNHFVTQLNNPSDIRTFFPKGDVAKIQVIDDNRVPLDIKGTRPSVKKLVDGVREKLVSRFGKLRSLGKVYIDERLKQQMVPFAMRSAAKALRTIARGSRMALPDTKVVRFFLWWKNGKDRVDIDLSACFYSHDWNLVSQVTYWNLRDEGCYHSGDITTAPKGACEFIDVDVPTLLKRGVRYVTMAINSYTTQPYCDLPECFAGWMGRNEPNSGEIFEARTVQDKVDLATDATMVVPMIFDLVERQMIWADLGLKSKAGINNVHSNKKGLALMGKAITDLRKPNLYDLFSMHAEARGTLVKSPGKAKTVFSIHEGITPFDYTKIANEFLA